MLWPAPGRTFAVSLGARRGSSSALTSYNSLRASRTRLARRVLGLGLRTGLAQPLLRDKIDIGVLRGAASAELAEDLITDHLQRLFGRGPVGIAVSGGSGPFRKPVLQVFAADGMPLGYIKVGWNDWTRQAVSREAAALQACMTNQMLLGVPPLLDRSSWRNLDLLVTGPLPRGIRRTGAGSGPPDARVLREISELVPGSDGELAASPWWLGVRSRIHGAVVDPEARSALELAAERIERAYGSVPLKFGTWHGDLVPWNLGRCGTRLYAWDWESSTPDVPLGFDAVHFYYSVAFIARGRPLAEAAASAAGSADAALKALGVPERSRHLVAILHLVELALRHEEARQSTGEADGRFYPAVTRVLERAIASSPGVAGPQPTGRAA
ncbi:MAG TPA: hypothetical protein VMU94_26005 [Streptosporangiaceae bacterium]|nr:hypothetical protein [Streptosporangiaceae bacterium]